MNRSSYAVVLLAGWAAAALTLGACGKSSPALDFGNQSGDILSDAPRKDSILALQDEYGIKVTVADDSYANEHAVNRVIQFLAQNLAAYKEPLKALGVIEIWIGDAFDAAEIPGSGGKLALRVARGATTEEIRYFLDHCGGRIRLLNLRTTYSKKLGLAIRDTRGLGEDQMKLFLDRAEKAAQGFDFTQRLPSVFQQAMTIDQVYAISDNSFLVPFDATEDGLRSFFGKTIDLAKKLKPALAQASGALGVPVGIQPEVLTPDEISAGLENLQKNGELFRTASGKKIPILLGRRTETDLSRVLAQQQLLISFAAGPDEIRKALDLVEPDSMSGAKRLVSDFVADYQVRGIKTPVTLSNFGVAEDRATPGSVDFVRSVLGRVRRAAPPERLVQLRINQLNPVTSSYSAGAEITNEGRTTYELYVRFDNGMNEALLDSVLQQHQARIEQRTRLETQQALFRNTWHDGGYDKAQIQMQLPPETLNPASGAATQTLVGFLISFRRIAAPERLLALHFTQVAFVRGAASDEESVLPMGQTLRVDPYRVTPAQLEQTLYDLEHPAPAPTPHPRPTTPAF